MELVLTKWIGMEATVLLASEQRETLLRRFPAALLLSAEGLKRKISVREDEEAVRRCGAEIICPLGEGGVLTALWKLAEEMRAGLEVDIRKIPIRQETIEICEYFDINPYYVRSQGSLLLASEEGNVLTERLMREGIEAAVIGRLTGGNDRILWNDGNKRFLDRPQRDEIYKCQGQKV